MSLPHGHLADSCRPVARMLAAAPIAACHLRRRSDRDPCREGSASFGLQLAFRPRNCSHPRDQPKNIGIRLMVRPASPAGASSMAEGFCRRTKRSCSTSGTSATASKARARISHSDQYVTRGGKMPRVQGFSLSKLPDGRDTGHQYSDAGARLLESSGKCRVGSPKPFLPRRAGRGFFRMRAYRLTQAPGEPVRPSPPPDATFLTAGSSTALANEPRPTTASDEGRRTFPAAAMTS
jgi:hypothetical protein